jgi:glycerol-3-phosphate dehydrogenase
VAELSRDPERSASAAYDLIIIGGGVYGIAVTLESALRGLKPLLLERSDFGAGTSANSLRILHGGLRSLQTLDLRRFRDSVRERRSFLREFPDLVKPLPCLMPLYGNGLRRPAVMRAALLLNDTLSVRRNLGVRYDRHIPSGRMISADATATIFPAVRRQGLLASAIWHDAQMLASQRILIEMLRWARSIGGDCVNYCEATSLVTSHGCVAGVQARDVVSDTEHLFRAPVVINCAGPDCEALAAHFDRPKKGLFRPSLAFNLLLDRRPPADVALAVSPPRKGGRVYFVLPWHERVMAGTFHSPFEEGEQVGAPRAEHVARFLSDLNDAIPDLGCTAAHVRWVFWGLLPVTAAHTEHLEVREKIVDHGRSGGARGLYTVSGVKFTTARLVAQRTLLKVFGYRSSVPDPDPRPQSRTQTAISQLSVVRDGSSSHFNIETTLRLRQWAENEAVVHLDDLLLRRIDWQGDPTSGAAVARASCKALGWDDERTRLELARLAAYGIDTGFEREQSPPANVSAITHAGGYVLNTVLRT